MPEDEVRSLAMEVKVGHEKALQKMLDAVSGPPPPPTHAGTHASPRIPAHPHYHRPPNHPFPLPFPQMRKENAKLEAEVTAMDSKARVIKAGAEGRVAALQGVVRAAGEAAAAGVGTVAGGGEEGEGEEEGEEGA